MSAAVLAALLATGVAAGVLGGLVGIGGGVLMVPLLYFLYGAPEFSGFAAEPAIRTVIAHATSLFVIVPTAIVGTWSFARAGLVVWRAALPIAVFSMAGALLGARLALLLPGDLLRFGFGIFLTVSAIQLARGRSAGEAAAAAQSHHPYLVVPAGVMVGAFSALLGVGGGLVAVPLLLHVLRLDIRQIAATSLAIICFAAPAGVAAYMVWGWDAPGLPAGSVGYVHLAAAVPLLIGATLAVPWGAALNRRMETRTLRRVFAAALFILGLRLVLGGAWRLW